MPQLNNAKLSELGLDNLWAWPLWVRLLVVSIASGVLLGASYFMVLSKQIQRLTDLQKQEQMQKQKIATKQAIVAAMSPLQEKLLSLRTGLNKTKTSLVTQQQASILIDAIAKRAGALGLQLESIKQLPQQSDEDNMKLPIAIRVSGDYHHLGEFVGVVASLPKLVVIKDFTLATRKLDDSAPASKASQQSSQMGNSLTLNMRAIIYSQCLLQDKKMVCK